MPLYALTRHAFFTVFAYILMVLSQPSTATWRKFSDIQDGDSFYYVNEAAEIGPPISSAQDMKPTTVLTVDVDIVTAQYLQEKLDSFQSTDDVWSTFFLQAVIVQRNTTTEAVLSMEARLYLERLGTTIIHSSFAFPADTSTSRTFAEGPYFLLEGKLHAAYLLYPDTAEAFMVATMSTIDPFRYRSLNASVWGEQYPSALSIAVPSRLRYVKTPEVPFAGVRLGIKDNMNLQGLETGASSRAFTNLYGPRNTSAAVVEKLLQLGFVIVGKLRLTQFADSEWPTADWVDYHAPWNPRGEGYQVPSGSSSGSAAAIAAYPWLDVTLGTDTLGSIRAPAATQGIFGMRPSLGAIGLDGIVPYSREFDTVGGLSRSAADLSQLCKAFYDSAQTVTCSKRPTRILYSHDYWPVLHEESQAEFEKFVSQLEAFLGVQRTSVNLNKLWQATSPVKTTLSLEEYFENTFLKAAHRDQLDFLNGVISDCKQANNGVPPIFDYKAHQEGLHEKAIFRAWVEKEIITPTQDNCSESILLLPWTKGEPNYRDTYRDPPTFNGSGFFFYNWSSFAEAPEIIVPAGQTPYYSRLSQRIEYLLAAIGIVGAKESDLMLVDLVTDFMAYLNASGGVRVGRTSFPVPGAQQLYQETMTTHEQSGPVDEHGSPPYSEEQQPFLPQV